MGLTSELVTRLRGLFSRSAVEHDLDEELLSHIEMETEHLVSEGVPPAEARRRALMAFGSVPKAVEECREERGVLWVEDTVRDVRQGSRSLARAPRFSLAVLFSLGLGVAAVLVVFSLMEAVLLNGLPYQDPERLVLLNDLTPEGGRFSTSDLNVLDYRERVGLLDGIAVEAYPAPTLLLEVDGAGRALQGLRVSGNFFAVFGVDPVQGRWWTDAETAPGTDSKLVVVSSALWRGVFGAEQLVDQTLRLGGETWTIIGVVPPQFFYGPPRDVWVPYAFDLERNRGDHRLSAIARIGPFADFGAANEEIAAAAQLLAEEYPEQSAGWSAELQPIRDVLIGADAQSTTIALSVAVAMLLLLACSSVSGLMMARSAARERELSLRRALGAARGRLIRQLVTESLLLAALGTLLGLVGAAALVPIVRRFASDALPRVGDMALSPTVIAVAFAISVVSGLLFGIAPALRATAIGSAGSRGTLSLNLRSVLVMVQLAMALMLVTASGTLYQSFSRMTAVHPGFDAEQLLAVDVTLPPDRYPEGSQEVMQYYETVLERVAAVPGVTDVSASTLHPFVGPALANTVGLPEMTDKVEFQPVAWRAVTSGTFRTMGLPMLRGRDFEATESQLVTVISENLATRLFGDEDPIGRGVRWISPQGPVATVVGVVSDARDLELTSEPLPTYYWFQGHMRWTDLSLLLRTDLDPQSLVASVRAAVRDVDPLLPPLEIGPVERDLREVAATSRMNLQVFGTFALLASLIALVGLYGLVSYTVANRRSEIAVRLAVGARPLDVSFGFVRNGLRLLAVGVAAGLFGMVFLTQLLQQLLFETTPLEPVVVIGTVSFFALATLAASVLPALRVARQNPVGVLRSAD